MVTEINWKQAFTDLGVEKKTAKTPKKEIEKTERIMKQYFDAKK